MKEGSPGSTDFKTVLDSEGNEIHIGDNVVFENGKALGAVVHILEHPIDLETWALEESGTIVEAEGFGWVFLPASSFTDHKVQIASASDVAEGDKH